MNLGRIHNNWYSGKCAAILGTFIIVLALMSSSLFIKDGHAVSLAILLPPSSNQGGKVFVMCAGSLVKTFEKDLGPAFQTKTNYTYTGEGRGSLQIANMILDGQRRPGVFVSAGTIPISKLFNSTGIATKSPVVHGLIKFAAAQNGNCIFAHQQISC